MTTSIAWSAESATEQLNQCVKDEQIKKAATGAAIGAITGLLGALVTGKKDKIIVATAAGAALGGGAGWMQAYMTSNKNCRDAHPEWLAESDIVRDPSKQYEQVKKEHNYNGKNIVAYVQEVTPFLDPNNPQRIIIRSKFDVLTPDGAETVVGISRKLYIVSKDKSDEASLLENRAVEQRTLEVGRNIDQVAFIHTPPPEGTDTKLEEIKYRLDVALTIDGKESHKLKSSVFSLADLKPLLKVSDPVDSETNLDSSKSYEQIKQEYKYKGKQSQIAIKDIKPVTNPVTADQTATIDTVIDVLTPGATEATVTVKRQLYRISKQSHAEEVQFAQKASEEKTLVAGRNIDKITFTPSAPAGMNSTDIKYRLDVSVRSGSKEISKSSKMISVK